MKYIIFIPIISNKIKREKYLLQSFGSGVINSKCVFFVQKKLL